MARPKKTECRNCKWFVLLGKDICGLLDSKLTPEYGRCHRRCPSVVVGMALPESQLRQKETAHPMTGCFPFIHKYEWCGDFELGE